MKTINLNYYITFDTLEYDGYGEMSIKFDKEKLLEDLSNYIRCELNKTSKLSNGDVITLEWKNNYEKFAEKYKVTIKAEDMEIAVKELEEIEKVDIFEGINVTFSGIAPNGSASNSMQFLYHMKKNLLSAGFQRQEYKVPNSEWFSEEVYSSKDKV